MESTVHPEDEGINFQKYWLILRRRWLTIAGVCVSVVMLTTFYASLQEPIYEAEGKLLIKTTRTPSFTGLGEKIGELNSVSGTPLDTEVEIVRSVPIAQKTVAALKLKNEQGLPLKPQVISSQLDVTSIKGTDVLKLSYTSADPKEAAAIVNKLMTIYIQNNVVSNRAEAAAARQFISKQLPKTEATVSKAESALRRFKENNKVVALTEEANSSVSVLANLKNQIAQAEANLADVSARSAELRRKIGMSPQEALAASSLSQSAGVQTALADYQKIDSQLALERTRFRDTTPAIADLEDKRAALRAILKERVRDVIASQSQVPAKNLQVGTTQQKLIEDAVQTEVQRLGLASQVAVLSNVKSTFEQRADTLPRLEQNQRELERKLNAAQSTYEVLLKKLQEAQVAENQNIGNARILETAVVPSQPINSRTQQSALIGGILGLLLGSAAALILEARDTSIKTISEARELFGYTLLGTIPFVGKKVMLLSRDSDNPVPELPVRDTPRSPVSEAYRMLQANLKFLSSDQPLKVIVVTSSIPKEGKSTISANLAAAIAQLGRKVLLVDADMRHPLQHHIWELTNAVGLSDVLVAQAEFKTAVKEVMPNLHVLSSGVMPPNPVALLDSKRMASLVEGFAASYDFVIFDTPPLVGVADTPILGKMASGILLVVRPGVVTVASGSAAQELLKQSGQKVLGMVMNGVVLENEPDSYFHYLKSYSVEDSPASRAKAISQAQQGTKHT